MTYRRATILAILASLFLTAGILAIGAGLSAALAVEPCPKLAAAPWRFGPDGCFKLRPGQVRTLPSAASEVDIYSANGRVHLRQRPAPIAGGWAFYAPGGYAAGWVTVNRDVFAYGRRTLRVYYWKG